MSVQELIARFMRQERHPDLDLIAALLRQGDAKAKAGLKSTPRCYCVSCTPRSRCQPCAKP
jgi:hypothetical protein